MNVDAESSDAPQGGCQCGKIRFAITAGLGRASICHCRMCQKAFGNAFAPLVSARGLRWLHGEPSYFRSSNRAKRGFCGACGTPLSYEADGLTPEIAIAALDDPSVASPVIQMGTDRRLAWVDSLATLPTRSAEEAAEVAPFYASVESHQHPDQRDE